MNEKLEKILSLEEELRTEIKNNLFFSVFNPRVKELRDMIKQEQETCDHDYDEDNICIYCHKVYKREDE